MRELLEEKELKVKGIPIKVKIFKTKEEFVPIYFVDIPELGVATKAIIEKIKRELATEVRFSPEEIIDPTKSEKIIETFREAAEEKIEKYLLVKDEFTKKILAGYIIIEMLGLGKIDILLGDDDLEEIAINSSKEPAWVYHKKYGWLKTNIYFNSEDEIYYYAQEIGRKVGRQIDILHPLLDAHLPTGDRVNATLFPISTCGNTITIRKFRRDPFTFIDLINFNTANPEIIAFIWETVQYEMNVLISGGTGSGKTTFLNSILLFIPPNQRIISIEDSVRGDEEIIVRVNGVIKRMKVKEFVENYKKFENCEVLTITKDFKAKWSKVRSVFKHRVRKKIYKIRTRTGRVVEVTGDHSLFTLKNFEIVPIKASELKIGDRIIVPRYLPIFGEKDSIDLIELLKDSWDIYVTGEKVKKIIENNYEKLRKKYGQKAYNWKIKGRIPIKVFYKISKERDVEVVGRFGKFKSRALMKITKDFAYLLGCWIADGCYDKNSILISMPDEETRKRIERLCKELNISTSLHRDGITIRINSYVLKRIMTKLGFLGDSKERRIPEFIFNLRKDLVSELLKGIFSGNGWVKKNEIALSSASEKLIRDIQTLLLGFGIISRISRTGGMWELRISDVKYIRKFVEEIGFGQREKMKKAIEIIKRKIHEVSDTFEISPELMRKLKYLAREKMEMTYNSWKSMHSRYAVSRAGRQYLLQIIEGIEDDECEKVRKVLEGDIYLDEIKEIEVYDYEGDVYDLSVPETEAFICNNILCHNTRELRLPDFLHWVPLTTRNPNPEGKGEVTMLDLLVNSLRMRPDRIVVGEVRRKEEAEVMFEAMRTGHSVYATFHANTAEHTIRRLTSPPIELHPETLEALQIIVTLFRHRRKGIRRVLQVAEVVPGEREGVRLNLLYRWRPATDTFIRSSDSMRVFAELELFTGLTPSEIWEDIGEKMKVLEWMKNYNIRSIFEVGKVMATYYSDNDYLMELVNNNKDPRGELL